MFLICTLSQHTAGGAIMLHYCLYTSGIKKNHTVNINRDIYLRTMLVCVWIYVSKEIYTISWLTSKKCQNLQLSQPVRIPTFYIGWESVDIVNIN